MVADGGIQGESARRAGRGGIQAAGRTRRIAGHGAELQPQGLNIALVFHGLYCILIGYLILGSTFLPRILGGLMAFAGLGWLTYLSNPLVYYLSPYNLASGLLEDVSVYLWLLVMGVNVQRWKEQASAAGES